MRIRWKGFELPTKVVLEEEKPQEHYGKFHVEPFERGFPRLKVWAGPADLMKKPVQLTLLTYEPKTRRYPQRRMRRPEIVWLRRSESSWA